MYDFEVKSGYDRRLGVTYNSVVLVDYDDYEKTTINHTINKDSYVKVGKSESETILVCTSINSDMISAGEAKLYISGKLKTTAKFDTIDDLISFKDYFWETFDMVELSKLIGESDYDDED